MNWIYYATKIARMLFWTEVMIFFLFSLVQISTINVSVIGYTIPLVVSFVYIPAITTFMTTIGIRDREFDEERRSLKQKKRNHNNRNVSVRSSGKPRK